MRKKTKSKRRHPRVIVVSKHQIGKSVRKIDKRRKALKPGKRISKNGKVYYESRKNRSDLRYNV